MKKARELLAEELRAVLPPPGLLRRAASMMIRHEASINFLCRLLDEQQEQIAALRNRLENYAGDGEP